MAPNVFLLVLLLTAGVAGCTKLSTTEPDPVIPPVVDQGMVRVDGGYFIMGSALGDANEKPIHSVTVGAFSMDKYEITFEKWTEVRKWAAAHGYTDLPAGRNGFNPVTENNPVTEVNWYDVVKWCNARSEKDGFSPVYYTNSTHTTVYRTGEHAIAAEAVHWTANGYRLPTEAEWEYAARGGTRPVNMPYSGDSSIAIVAWYHVTSGNVTHHVGTRSPNVFGVYDMSGNAAEWCWDWYGAYTSDSQSDPKGPAVGSYHLLRGGSFNTNDFSCRIFYRNYSYPTYRYYNLGFRCVQD